MYNKIDKNRKNKQICEANNMKNPLKIQEMIEQKVYNIIDNKLKKSLNQVFLLMKLKILI